MSTTPPPDDAEIDRELMLAVPGYDPVEKYPEWGNAGMREAYLAGWHDGRATKRS